TLVLTISMQGLVRRVIGLSWRELLIPLAPSALAAVGAASMVALDEMLVKRMTPAAADWHVLLAQIALAGVFWIAFVLFARFGALQDVVDEVLNDLAPGAVRRYISRLRPANLGEHVK